MKIEEMDIESLERRIDEVTQEIAEIKTQLDYAKRDAAANGRYSDRDWFNRANHALRMKGREHQLLQRQYGKLRSQARQSQGDSAGQRFIDAAKRRLDPELFQDLMREATES